MSSGIGWDSAGIQTAIDTLNEIQGECQILRRMTASARRKEDKGNRVYSHVRLVAPLEMQIRRHAERAGLTADPSLYDLAINTGKIVPVGAADLITKGMDSLPVPA